MYVEIYHRQVNAFDIQNSCDVISQVIMQLMLVKFEAYGDRYIEDIRTDEEQYR